MAQGPNGGAVAPGIPSPGPERSSWSVTVEFHEAADPAESKRVVRIARLHLRSYEEVVEILRKVSLGPLKVETTSKE